MMIHRHVRDRLETLAAYLHWDHDPYLVITPEGRAGLDGGWLYDLRTRIPSRASSTRTAAINYIRNAVKATVDAYDGETHMYIFDPRDPMIEAYQKLFPDSVSKTRRRCRPDLRAHARYPESCSACRRKSTAPITCAIRRPSTTRRTCGIWRGTPSGKCGAAAGDADLCGRDAARETKPEFLLMTPFTPRSRTT